MPSIEESVKDLDDLSYYRLLQRGCMLPTFSGANEQTVYASVSVRNLPFVTRRLHLSVAVSVHRIGSVYSTLF
jgi:hypothetical protein